LSSAKEVTSYKFEAAKNVALASDVIGIIDSGAYTIALTVPYGTDLTALVATFELSTSAAAKIGINAQVSGTTANNFTNPITYTVKAKNGSARDWVVTVTVAIGPLDHFTITGYPTSTTAGQNFGSNNIIITAYDGNSKIKNDFTGTVVFSSNDGSAVLPGNYTFTSGAGLDNGTHIFSGTGFTLKTAGSKTITLTDGTIFIASSAITVTAGSLNYVKVENASGGAGSEVDTHGMTTDDNFTVYATGYDEYGNYISDQSVSWIGIGVCSANLTTPGTSTTFTPTATGTGTITAHHDSVTDDTTGTITVTAGAATKILVETATDGSGEVVPVQNLAQGNSITVYAISRDAQDNFVENVVADSWSLGKTDGVVDSDLVPGTGNKSAVFSAHMVGTAVINVTKGVLTSTSSDTITVTAGAATSFIVTTEHSETETAGTAFSVTVIAKDGNGNTATGYTGAHSIVWTWTANNSPNSTAPIKPVDGNQAFSIGAVTVTGFTLSNSGEIPTITATADSVNGTSSAITVAAATKNKLLWVTQPVSLVLTGATWATFTIEITDKYGNRTSDTGNVTIAPSSLTLGGTTTQAASGGLATFNNITCSTAGTITITGSATGLTSTPVSDEVTVVNTIVSGKIRDATTTYGISGATVTIESTYFSDTTDSNGDYSFSNVPAGFYSIKASKTDYVDGTESITVVEGQTTSKDIILTPSLTEGKIRIILTWATSDDLDSHLITPSTEFYYANSGSVTTEAMLDCDDTDGYGPETMTINTLNDGTYTYKVYDWSGGYSTIADCGAVVKLYDHTGLLETYTPNVISCPQNSWWTVFTLTVTGGGTVVVNDVNTVP
jgi:hypothetical protein